MCERVMRAAIWTFCGALIAASSGGAQTTVAADSNAQIVSAVRRGFIDAARRGDTAAARLLVTDTFGFVHSTGHFDDWRQNFRFWAQAPNVLTTEVSPLYVERHGDVIVARSHTAGTLPSGQVGALRGLAVYVRGPDGRWRWAHQQSTLAPTRPAGARLSRALLADYAGEYQGRAGTRTLTATDSTLRMTGGRDIEFVPLTESSFVAADAPMYLAFVRDATGRVIGFDLLRFGHAEPYRRTPSAR